MDYTAIQEYFGDINESDLERLETTLSFGEDYCEGFHLIFKNAKLSRYQDADAKIRDILAQVKAFEFLSRKGFSDITKMGQKRFERLVDFTANKSNENYVTVVTRLNSAQYIENHSDEYEMGTLKEWLATDIANTIDQQYQRLEEFCQGGIGTWKGIIFISGGRDYFGEKRYENKLYGLPLGQVTVVLNREWRARKEGQEDYKYLHHIVVTMGKNILKAIILPSF